MDKEEFRRRRAAIKAKSDKLWGDIEEHRTEEKRVIDVLHNAESILEKLDMTFEERTSLSKTDVSILMLATALQLVRIYCLPKFQEKLQVCRDLFHGFDYQGFIGGSPLTMAKLIADVANFVLAPHVQDRKDLFLKEALLTKQAMSLCSSMTTEKERHEAAYFEAVRSTVIKLTYGGSSGKPLSLKEINAQINELLKASIQSEGVISMFDSRKVGENFSLFDPAVLDEISRMKQKNIAVEILKRLLAEQVSIYKRTNVVQSAKFSEMITRIMNAYYNGHISNDEVIKELMEAAELIAKAHEAGDALGLTQEELAFYDALTRPQAIKDFYGNAVLVEMTRELTEMLRKNRTIDWQKKETARATMRKMVKRLLKKYKYPPEEYEDAIDTVINQCEMWVDN